MAVPTVHYVHDPLCGWCYAATPLIEAVVGAEIKVTLHGGGLWDAATALAPAKADYIRQNDARIAHVTGMEFGRAYLDGLLSDPKTVLWSRPTVAAVLAAGAMEEGADLRMVHAIQRAHYVDGQRVVEIPVLARAAGSIGLPEHAFVQEFARAPVEEHIAQARKWMRQLGLRGFPTFVLELGGELARIEHEPFYGRAQAFLHAVKSLAAASIPSGSPSRFACLS
jgi:putative protein-disulfide isomerase